MTQQVKIIEFEPHHLLLLDLQERQQYVFDQFESAKELFDYGTILLDNAVLTDSNNKCAWSAFIGDTMIGCGGIMRSYGSVGESWILTSDLLKPYYRKIIPYVRAQAIAARVERVYAMVDLGFDRAERFIQWLGFECEGTLRRSGLIGQDQKIYARIREI